MKLSKFNAVFTTPVDSEDPTLKILTFGIKCVYEISWENKHGFLHVCIFAPFCINKIIKILEINTHQLLSGSGAVTVSVCLFSWTSAGNQSSGISIFYNLCMLECCPKTEQKRRWMSDWRITEPFTWIKNAFTLKEKQKFFNCFLAVSSTCESVFPLQLHVSLSYCKTSFPKDLSHCNHTNTSGRGLLPTDCSIPPLATAKQCYATSGLPQVIKMPSVSRTGASARADQPGPVVGGGLRGGW